MTDTVRRAKPSWKLIAGGIVLALALVWLVLFFTVGGDFYQTVEEVTAAGTAENIRVGGRVGAGGLVQEGDVVRFTLEGDTGATLPVVYRGAYPERLGPYQQVVAAGSLGADGAFQATQVLVKCPDKLFPEKVVTKGLSGVGLERVLY